MKSAISTISASSTFFRAKIIYGGFNMRILSIDFDYFVDADIITRYMYFPDGNDNLPLEMNRLIWDNCYNFRKELKDIGVIDDYNTMCNFLSTLKTGRFLYADSHRQIERFFSEIRPDEELELINIDFHHDMFVTGGSKLDCGNWLRFLVDLKPDAKITWVRREDSDTSSFFGEFPYHHTTDISEVQGEFDLVFLCFSSPWSPPHLYDKFMKMVETVKLNKF